MCRQELVEFDFRRGRRDAFPAFSVLFWGIYHIIFASVKLYDAIHEMRRLTREGVPFSITYMSYNSTKGTSDGIITVRSAKLRKRESREDNRNAEDQEAYLNLDTNEPRRFWHPLLMEFNGEKVTL